MGGAARTGGAPRGAGVQAGLGAAGRVLEAAAGLPRTRQRPSPALWIVAR